MELKDIDFTKKENQTFNNWFKLMWKNFFIGLFILSIGFLIVIINSFDTTEFASYLAICLPIVMIILIAYKGFYQFWDDLKKGKTR